MNYSTADKKAVFSNEHCRRIFGQSQYTTLTKKREIRSTIRDEAISVAGFSDEKLVIILSYLIRQGIFHAEASIRLEFPDLYQPGLASTHQGNKLSPDKQLSGIGSSCAWLESLFKNSQYSDLILISHDKNYPAHRAVVCSQSSVINKKCHFQNATQDPLCDTCGAAPEYRFDFKDDDPQSVDCLIQYLYRQDYQVQDERKAHGVHESEEKHQEIVENPDEITLSDDRVDNYHPVFHVRVYALAEKYNIPALKRLALDKFNNAAQQGISSDRFLYSAEEAYTSTIPEDRGMRDSIVKYFYTNPELLDDEHTQENIQGMHSLLYDLLMYWHREHTELRPPLVG